jgi:hypothetical protein
MYERFKRDRPRGRPTGRFNVYHDLRSIATIAEQYGFPLKQFVAALADAWRHQNSQCGLLKIQRRGHAPALASSGEVTLLITDSEQVVSQFSINVSILRNPSYYIH